MLPSRALCRGVLVTAVAWKLFSLSFEVVVCDSIQVGWVFVARPCVIFLQNLLNITTSSHLYGCTHYK